MARPPMKQGLYGITGPGGPKAGFTGYMWKDRSGVTPAGKRFGGQFHTLDAETAGRLRKEYASGGMGPNIERMMAGDYSPQNTGGLGQSPPPNPAGVGWGQSPPSTSYMGGGGGMSMGGGGGVTSRGGGGMVVGGGFGGRRSRRSGGQSNAFSNYSRNLGKRRMF